MNSRRKFLKQSSLAGLALTTALTPVDQHPVNDPHKASTDLVKNQFKYLNFIASEPSDPIVTKAAGMLKRILAKRTGLNFSVPDPTKLDVYLAVVPESMPAESFRIEHRNQATYIVAGDPQGILYGLGKFLHTATLSTDGFIPGSWQGLSVPEKPFRMIYFATHFHNFYHDAPIEQVTEYIQELTLWGYNSLNVWFDMHHFTGIEDIQAQRMLDRLAQLLNAGKSIGMKTMITVLGNEGYQSTPEALRITSPLQLRQRGMYGVEICPSQPGGPELIVKQIEEEIDAFKRRGVALDYFSVWPYDQGGCGCSNCTPWGSNGYLKMTRLIAALVRKKLPVVKIVQSTWLFDVVEDEGEWAGLAAAYKREKPPVDYLMADSHETFPRYLLNNPVPGDLPLLNFPEISMWGSWPWGGFGANPLPSRFQHLWNSVNDKVAGGYPYSEGLFDDLNKVIYSQFYWDSRKPAVQSAQEYVAYEFSAAHADKIMESLHIMEKNHGLSTYRAKDGSTQFKVPQVDHGAKRANQLLTDVDHTLPDPIRTSWRWRILRLRAMFDYELRLSTRANNEKLIMGFQELSAIYSAKNADANVRPPLT